MENQRIIMVGIAGGSVAAFLNATPFLNLINCFCCIGILLGGAAGLFYYDRLVRDQEYITTATAVTVGLTCGIIGAFISLILEWIYYNTFGDWQYDLLLALVENMDEVPDYIDEMMVEFENSLSYGYMWTSVFFRNILILPIFCLAGSLLMRIYLIKNRTF